MKKFWDNSNGTSGADTPFDKLRAGFVRQPASPNPSGAGTPVRDPASLKPVPARLTIGSVTISPATVLAPMAGVTDTVFRRFIRNLGGCGLIMTEFTSADGVLRKKDQKAKRYLHFYEDEHPISAQLFGSDPSVMAEAARMVEGLGFDLVDLNLGCPAKKVVKCNGGSGLLRDLPAIGKIFEAVRAAVNIPFTVKFRAGWNDEEIVCVELARMAESCGLAAVALHARTREMGYSGQARWEWIAAIKDAVKIPVIGNGDIRSPEDACAMVAQTGCDAVMIGRSAPSNPWIFRQIEQYCAGMSAAQVETGAEPSKAYVGTAALGCPVEQSSTVFHSHDPTARVGTAREGHDLSRAVNANPLEQTLAAEGLDAPCHPEEPAFGDEGPMHSARTVRVSSQDNKSRLYDHPSEADRYQMIRTYFQMLIEEELPDAVGKMKQFASWFTHGVPGGAHLRKEIYESKSAPEILSRVEDFFEARLCGAGAPAREC
jgi:tRNA-dihydrouridine synthase B